MRERDNVTSRQNIEYKICESCLCHNKYISLLNTWRRMRENMTRRKIHKMPKIVCDGKLGQKVG